MAKEKNLTAVTSVAAADFARVVTSAGASVKATFANIAKYIVETYNGSTVAGSAQSVKSALDSLNSKTAIKTSAVSGGALSGLYVSKVGDVLYVRAIYISPSSAISAGTGVTLCTLPEGFRPSATVYFGGTFTNGSGHPVGFRGDIASDGLVRAIFEESVPTSASLFGTITAIYG